MKEEIVPRAVEGLFEADGSIDRGIFRAGFNFLNVAAAEIGFFGESFLGQFGDVAQTANILTENDMRLPFHR